MNKSAQSKTCILIIHQNFPGQFRQIAAHLVGMPDVEVIGIGKDTAPGIPLIKCIKYRLQRIPSKNIHPYLCNMEAAVLHGQAVVKVLRQLKQEGFEPDVVLAHPGWGETLYLREVYPKVKLIHFCEWYYHPQGGDVGFDPEFPASIDDRLKVTTWNAHHLLSLEQCDIAISPTHWQKSQYPSIYHDKINVIHEGIDTAHIVPDADTALQMPNGVILKAGDQVITYVARNLEPYRGFHTLMRTLPALLAKHPHCHVVIVGGDEVSYGQPPKDAPNWRLKMLKEVSIDSTRVHFLGKVPYPIYKKILQLSAVHIYLTYPFVLSWSLLEAMATGCLIVASNTAPVKEVVQHGKNGLLVDFFSSQQIIDAVSLAFADKTFAHGLRAAATQTVQKNYALRDGIQRYVELILNLPVNIAEKTVSQVPAQITLPNSITTPTKFHQSNHNQHPASFTRRVGDTQTQHQLNQLGLTQRELQILKCLSQGMEDKAISVLLQISTKTVSSHVSSVINKLAANNRSHAVAKVFHSSALYESNQIQKSATR
jgi:glycosyltransferase involved in cell wall biosynthesis/DNA-binding CsgD family transcriptional regulator